jgi:hypothetical protein
MKTSHKTIFLTLLFVTAMTFPTTASSIVPTSPASNNEKSEAANIQRLTDRLEEIRSMDLKNLTRKEKRELRHEVKSIQKVQSAGRGVYLSVGAIIIIILLLILIL